MTMGWSDDEDGDPVEVLKLFEVREAHNCISDREHLILHDDKRKGIEIREERKRGILIEEARRTCVTTSNILSIRCPMNVMTWSFRSHGIHSAMYCIKSMFDPGRVHLRNDIFCSSPPPNLHPFE